MNNNKQSKVILYLGAGASYFAGYHTFVNFPDLLFNPDLRKSEYANLDPNSEKSEAIRKSLVENNKATTHDNFLWRLDGYNQFLKLNQSDIVLQDYLRGNNRLYDLFICTEQAISQISTSTVHHYSSKRVEMAKAVNGTVFENMHRVLSLYHDIAKVNGINASYPFSRRITICCWKT